MKTLKKLIEMYATEVRNGNNEKALSIAKEIRNFDETESEEINMNNNTNTSKKPFVFIPAKEIKEEIIMNAPVKETNVTTNNTTVKEESIMDKKAKDYTLNGAINATNWQEFRAVMKEAGISTGTKTYAQLVEEYNVLTAVEETVVEETTVIVPVGDMSSDKYYPELQEIQEEKKPEKKATEITIDRKHGDFLVRNIMKASFVASKGDSKGKRIIIMRKLFGVIKDAYSNNNELVDEAFIKGIINQLVTLNYITFKKYESGAIMFYPTIKARDYVKEVK